MKAFWVSAISVALLLAACGTPSKPPAAPESAAKPAEQPCCVFAKVGQDEDAFPRTGDRVFFAFDQSSLDDASRAQIGKWVAYLQKSPDAKMLLEGHADERGTREYNIALGARRANAVREFMVAQGIDPSRLAMTSYGKERPAVAGSDEAAWAQNRRVVALLR